VWVLGINWEWHDSAAAIVDGDGRVWACAEEERFTRVKHAWNTFPAQAAAHCLAAAGITWRDLDVIAVGWDLPRSFRWYYPERDRERLFKDLFGPEVSERHGPEIVFVEHHIAHALSAFHSSGFEDAGVLVIDGSGELYSTSIFVAKRATGLSPIRHWPRGFSLGAVYEAATRVLGMGELDAGKTMGLASYGNTGDSAVLPLGDLISEGRPFFDVHDATRYRTIVEMWMNHLTERFGVITTPAEQLDQDPVAVRLATSAQRTIEDAVRKLHAETACLTGSSQICLAGGVALNSVANGRLPEPIYVPPFSHDAGVALGAAWSVCPPTRQHLLESPYMGVDLQVGTELDDLRNGNFHISDYSPDAVLELLLNDKIGGIAEGRAEIGPRALGHRSIVGFPRDVNCRMRINALKAREMWRPLAPVSLPDYAPLLWPSQGLRELYMVGNAVVSSHGQSVMPAAVHVDGTTRPQVLYANAAPILESLLMNLHANGLPPVLINTSFNSRGEPIVNSAADAICSFRDLGLDFLILGDQLVQPIS